MIESYHIAVPNAGSSIRSARISSWLLALGCATVIVAAGCPRVENVKAAKTDSCTVIASIYPLALILQELGDGYLTVHTLLPSGATPHAYDPTPSAARQAHEALALFYVSDDLDGWAADLEAPTRIEVIELLPSSRLLPATHEHADADAHGARSLGAVNAHFWLDPLLVRDLLPSLAQELAELDPQHAEQYLANAERFGRELTALDAQITDLLAGLPSRALLMQHPSFQYFAQRYRLDVVGLIEAAPGKEPSPAHLEELVKLARERDVRVVFSEPQLSTAAAQAVAEAAGLPVFTLDPLGSETGVAATYGDLLLYNARQLLIATGGGREADGSG